jgi:membrane associated rhomboid family serine protease
VALGLILICSGIEAVLMGADLRLWGSILWRPLAYQYGGFWAGLLHGWTPNFAAQPVTMFASYAFLHAGLSHLAGNMLALVALDRLLAGRLGSWGFLALWSLAALAGALAFALILPGARVMVGTSGALFGLAGALLVWEAQARRHAGRAVVLWSLGCVLALVGLNALVWALQGGNLAWQAHLGGFVAGVGWGWMRPPRRV